MQLDIAMLVISIKSSSYVANLLSAHRSKSTDESRSDHSIHFFLSNAKSRKKDIEESVWGLIRDIIKQKELTIW